MVALTAVAQQQQPADLLIKGGTILTVTHGKIENGSILIHNGKIAAVGKNVSAPANAKVIDASGMHIGKPFRNVSGILSGQFAPKEGPGEMDRIAGMFNEEETRREPPAMDGR